MAFFGDSRGPYFFLVDGDQFDRVAFFLSVAYFAQFHCSCTQRCFVIWFERDLYGQIDLAGIWFHEHLWVAPFLFRFLVALNVGTFVWGFGRVLGSLFGVLRCWGFCGRGS